MVYCLFVVVLVKVFPSFIYLQIMHFLAAHLNEFNVEWGGVGLGTFNLELTSKSLSNLGLRNATMGGSGNICLSAVDDCSK